MRRYSSFVIRRRQWQRTTAKIAEKRCSLATGSVCSLARACALRFSAYLGLLSVCKCCNSFVLYFAHCLCYAGHSVVSWTIISSKFNFLPRRASAAAFSMIGCFADASRQCVLSEGRARNSDKYIKSYFDRIEKKLKAGDFWWAGWW